MQSVTFTLTVAERRRRIRVPSEMSLADLARVCIKLDQAVADDAARASRRVQRPVSCRKGCGACCRQPVPISAPEAWMIADVVKGLPEVRRQAVQARFEAALGTMDRHFARHHPLLTIANEYFALGIACPFLDDESCSIHADRPTVCREYLVTTPAELCTSLQSPTAFVCLPLRISECLARVAAIVLETAPTWIALVQALEWAKENFSDGERTWEARHLLTLLQDELSRSSTI